MFKAFQWLLFSQSPCFGLQTTAELPLSPAHHALCPLPLAGPLLPCGLLAGPAPGPLHCFPRSFALTQCSSFTLLFFPITFPVQLFLTSYLKLYFPTPTPHPHSLFYSLHYFFSTTTSHKITITTISPAINLTRLLGLLFSSRM